MREYTKYTIYFLSIIIITILLGVKNIKAEEEGERQQPPMVNADDLAKEELFLLGSFPQLLHGFKARDIFAGGYQSALISDTGSFYYWGLVANAGVSSPSLVQFFDPDNELILGLSLPSFSSLSLGGYHILAIDESGKLYSMGRAEGGVLGHNDDIDLPAPKLIDSMKKRNTKLTAAGYAHSVAVTDTGLFTWGRGERGQLGTGTIKNFDTPKLVKVQGVSPKNIKEICTGGYHTAILSEEGKVYTFGGNSYGALGHGHSNDLLSASPVLSLDHVFIVSISCGGDHTLALSKTGELFAWGWGEKGQLGTGNTENVFTPYKIDFEDKLEEGDEIASITAGGYATSFVVTKKGKVFGFGWGEFGILGNGGNDNLLEPTLIAGLTNITKIATGYKHALALTAQGDVYVFGEDTYGSLGLGDQSSFSSSFSSSSSPSIVSIPNDSQESILPSNFESVSPPVDERFLVTEKEWQAKGANDTSGVIVYNTVTGFADKEYGGREEKVIANAWAFGLSKQEKAKDNLEDYAIVVDRFGKELDDGFTRVVFGVYDGHNGKSIAEFSSFTLHKSLLRELKNTSQTTEQAITRAYEYTNEAVKGIIESETHTISGSTALTCVSVRNGSVHYLFSANSGDSRAVLSRKGKAIRLTHDDKATDESEAARIEAAGGKILNKRVGGVLAITRAIGDTIFNGIVIPTPHVSKQDISPLEDDYLILASDGLWDVMTDQEAVDMIQNEKDSQKASKILMKAAISRGSKDDITVLTARVVRPLFLG